MLDTREEWMMWVVVWQSFSEKENITVVFYWKVDQLLL